jgi:hypothetical protein
MSNINTNPCEIGREYASTIADIRQKRKAATSDVTFNGYAQAEYELIRIDRSHFKRCAACQAFETVRLKAAQTSEVA